MNTYAAVCFRLILFSLAMMFGASPAHALTLCANSEASLQTAFTVAGFAQEPATIRIATGTYNVPGLAVAFSAPTTLLGGYDAGCTTRPAMVRYVDTVLDFGGYGVFFTQGTGTPISSIAIDGVSLLNTYKLTIYAGDWGVESAIRLSRTRITGLPSSTEAVTLWTFGHGSIRLDNVLMDALPGGMPSGECSVDSSLLSGGVIEMVNTTIALPANKNLCLYDPNQNGSTANIYNTIVWSAIQTSVIDSYMSVVNSFNSTYMGLNRHGGTGPSVGELNTDPMWRNPAVSDYRLSAASTSVNSGTPAPPGGLATYDIYGQPRFQGELPDRGAYESDFLNAQIHMVTNTNDSGAGSLRDAMNLANQNPNLGIIKFAIPGGCPRVINLQTTLPKLTTPMLIDGMTQTGSNANTDDAAFNATLCVVVMPANGTLTYAFNAATDADDASLKLRGIAMGGFQQAVILAGGSDHMITGNRFGGFFGSGINLVGATLYSINVPGALGNGNFIIGGPGDADRNLISGSAFAGIRIQGGVDGSQARCQIVNNLIGTSPSGNTAAPNSTGIHVSGNHCLIDSNRIVGNSTDGIFVDGAFGTTIQRNIIGVAVNGNGLQNNGAGIRLAGAATNTVIGAPLSTYQFGLRNTVRYMAKAGIVIPSGINNILRSNEIRDNGVGADGLDIDLGDDGPTANDVGDTDTSFANKGQNFPLVSAIVIPPGTAANATNVTATLTGQLSSSTGNYRIDVYFSNHCSVTGGRGHADAYLGGTTADNLQMFSKTITLPNILSSGVVSLTATDKDGNTSEMGTCFPVLGGGGSELLFKGGFE